MTFFLVNAMTSVREQVRRSDLAAQALQALVASTKDVNDAGEWDPNFSVLGQYALEGRLEVETYNRKMQKLDDQHVVDMQALSWSGSVGRKRPELVI